MTKNELHYFLYTSARSFKENIYLIEYNPVVGYYSDPSNPFFTNSFSLGIEMLLKININQEKEV